MTKKIGASAGARFIIQSAAMAHFLSLGNLDGKEAASLVFRFLRYAEKFSRRR